jgi:hypothetical protein
MGKDQERPLRSTLDCRKSVPDYPLRTGIELDPPFPARQQRRRDEEFDPPFRKAGGIERGRWGNWDRIERSLYGGGVTRGSSHRSDGKTRLDRALSRYAIDLADEPFHLCAGRSVFPS